jgi:hypothetical protein
VSAGVTVAAGVAPSLSATRCERTWRARARLVAVCGRLARRTTSPCSVPAPSLRRHYYELDVEYGSPSSGVGKPQTHTPRRFFHFGLAGGRFTDGEVAFDYPLGNSGERSARRIGPATLGGIHGTLWMGRLWPAGGIWGGHLMFIWHRGPYRYLATLHTWRPLSQPRRVLGRIVASLTVAQRLG